MKQRAIEILSSGCAISLLPALIVGALVTWLAWDIKSHYAAVVAGTLTYFVVMWFGAWIGIVLQDASGWMEEER